MTPVMKPRRVRFGNPGGPSAVRSPMLSLSDPPARVLRARPALASIALAGVWFVLAWRTPTSTHHFAPLVVAAAWGFLADADSAAASRWAAGAGVVVAAGTVLALSVSDRLLGPTLWHSRPSWPELLGFAVLGGVITLVRGLSAGDRNRE